MQRGKRLEQYINYLVQVVNTWGGHAHKNNSLRTFEGINIAGGGEPWDYEFFEHDKIFCFDAKECGFLSSPSNKNQFGNLSAVNNSCGYALCGFLVWFWKLDAKNLYFFPIQKIKFLLNNNEYRLTPDIGNLFKPIDLLNRCTKKSFNLCPGIADF